MTGAGASPALESPGEVRGIGIAQGVGNLAQVHAGAAEQILGPFQADLVHQLLEAGFFLLQSPFECPFGDKQGACNPGQFRWEGVTGFNHPPDPTGKSGVFGQLPQRLLALGS